MEKIKYKTVLTIFFSLFIQAGLYGQDTLYKYDYFYFPKAYQKWDNKIFIGLSVTRLPVVVVEEEISQSPMLNLGFRLGLPWELNITSHFNTNYISTYK